ncbi:MAG: HesA/MoeB/ThiF family protein [Solirubrobacterales bacterium]
MSEDRYARQVQLLGAAGQDRIKATTVAIVGLGGLGSHVIQQLAYLGVRRYILIDRDEIEMTNLNRLVGAGPGDVGRKKIEIAERETHRIDVEAVVRSWPVHFDPSDDFPGLSEVDVLFGCVDEDPVRSALIGFTSRNKIPYIDLASDVTPDGEFGGRIVFGVDGKRCLSCVGELDPHAIARARMTDGQREADDKIYGVERSALADSGPSVVSVNGAVASLAVTEFMAWVTGLREPRGYITYRGDLPSVGVRQDPERDYCHYCMGLWRDSDG